jgi:hypothetical protein
MGLAPLKGCSPTVVQAKQLVVLLNLTWAGPPARDANPTRVMTIDRDVLGRPGTAWLHRAGGREHPSVRIVKVSAVDVVGRRG